MAITLSDAAKSAGIDAIMDLVDVGGGGTFEIKSGASTVAGTNELAILTFQNPAFAAASAGVAAANTPITSETSANVGTASDYTVFRFDGTAIWQGTVTVTGGGGDLQLSSVSIGAGDTVSCSSFTMTQP